jgi:hypothetical protein
MEGRTQGHDKVGFEMRQPVLVCQLRERSCRERNQGPRENRTKVKTLEEWRERGSTGQSRDSLRTQGGSSGVCVSVCVCVGELSQWWSQMPQQVLARSHGTYKRE